MFDRYIHATERTSQAIAIHEHRAPTDESVRLLSEMEQAARAKVVDAIRLEDSPIDGVVHAQDDYLNNRRMFCVFVRVKGKKLEVRKDFNMGASLEEIASGLLDSVSARIAAEILAPAFQKLPLHFRGAP